VEEGGLLEIRALSHSFFQSSAAEIGSSFAGKGFGDAGT